ncbi:FAD/FMN-containing dehydrogenase [Paenibacillus rhizosphaerae]|uniref:FAD/FMN-containing dehydrogenase n=1 Tax=Paenibacillus rhizosphaerae TaxID=297318 RepID=A0A839TM89_9BACL|nr:FAD-binding oxidoreductase [Paenibacillus rhizosphaerae]MBB3127984.1 FAD/FMN-containing dehydrogenase [Paenibacillus rhizosphaerae]
MSMVWKPGISEAFSALKLLTDETAVEKLSKDFYWYSPVLSGKLKDKKADAVLVPTTVDEIREALRIAYRHRIPVTVRGAGTGNYGQAIPLEGGLVLDLSGMNELLEIGSGYARVQCGVKLGVLEKTAREQGQELRIYPSTFAKATVGGFVCGGSGGVGSVTWGDLWDGNVLEATVLTMEEDPQVLQVHGEDLKDYIHNYGTTGIVTEVVIPLAPRTEWAQAVVNFERFEDAVRFGEALAEEAAIPKRLITPMEWPIPSFFKPLEKVIAQGKSVVFAEIAGRAAEALPALAADFGGEIGYVIDPEKYRKSIGLSDFTWNHTTLWALKRDPAYTYLQAGFKRECYLEQIRMLKSMFGDEMLLHFEWIRSRGKLQPNGLPVVRYSTEERLYHIIDTCRSIGVEIYDPHTWLLDNGGRGAIPGMQERKRHNDPLGLLNPGKMG